MPVLPVLNKLKKKKGPAFKWKELRSKSSFERCAQTIKVTFRMEYCSVPSERVFETGARQLEWEKLGLEMSALIDRQPTTEIVFLIYRKDFFFTTRIVHTALCRISQILNDAGSFPFASFFLAQILSSDKKKARKTRQSISSHFRLSSLGSGTAVPKLWIATHWLIFW